jgi:hypothetical protein
MLLAIVLKIHGFSVEAAKKKVQRWQKEGRRAEEMLKMARRAYPQGNGQE